MLPGLAAALAANDETARTVVFEDVDLELRIGAYAAERNGPQPVRISAELLVLPGAPLGGDDLSEVVDYDSIHRDMLRLADDPHVVLQETLAERVAKICLKPDAVAAVSVWVRKLAVYPNAKSVGVRIVRTRRSL